VARDPAQGVIRAFGWLMLIVFGASAGISTFACWALYRLVRHLVGA
jgi:hypothetical protein